VNVVGHRGAVRKSCLLVGSNAHRRTAASGFALASPHSDDSFVCVRIDIEAVIARLLHRERLVRSVDFIRLAVIKPAHVQVHCALMQLQLDRVLSNAGQRQAAFRIDPDQPRAHADFSARILVSPNIVGICERTILFASDPVTRALRLHRD
jgi:hypothetical protein